jgi:hypothetical protein
LENNLLAVRGELLSEIGIDRLRDSRERDSRDRDYPSPSAVMLSSSLLSHDREMDEMIQEGKKWRLLEVSQLGHSSFQSLSVCV